MCTAFSSYVQQQAADASTCDRSPSPAARGQPLWVTGTWLPWTRPEDGPCLVNDTLVRSQDWGRWNSWPHNVVSTGVAGWPGRPCPGQASRPHVRS